MPLYHDTTWKHGHQWALWHITENEDYFLDRLELHPIEIVELAKIKGRRRLEWLSCRYLVHLMIADEPEWDRIPLVKDEFGKPHLDDHELQVSFSHSFDYAAVIVGKNEVGIDIQKFVPKITVLERKFMQEEESGSLSADFRLEHLHIYWGAKESLYKGYGRKALDFRQHILITPFDYQESGQTTGLISKNGFQQQYEVHFEKIANYFLVLALRNG